MHNSRVQKTCLIQFCAFWFQDNVIFSVCLFVCLSVCLSVGLFVCTSVCIVYCLFCHFTFICICKSEAILDMGLYVSTSVTGSYIIHGTMADKMIYILHDGTQNYAFCRLQFVFETFGQSAKWTNPSKFNKSSQCY